MLEMLARTQVSCGLQQHTRSRSWCKVLGPAALIAVPRPACVQLDNQWAAVRAGLGHSKRLLAQPTACTVPPSYSRPHLEQLISKDPGSALMRGAQILFALLKLLLLHLQHAPKPAVAPLTAASSRQAAAATSSYAARVRHLLSQLGVLWVKVGQTLSVRPDLVGHQLAAALTGLQERAPPFDTAEALAIIQQDLGRPASELFACMSPDPVASASLGQVYQARLTRNGPLVAVKVQRPRVWEQVQLDLAILLLLLKLLKRAAGIKQDITLWADTLGNGLAQELDYMQEAHNLELFSAAHSHLDFVTTPEVVWQLTSHGVLTTNWMEGQTPGQMLRQARHTSTAHQGSQQGAPQQHTGPNQSRFTHQFLTPSSSQELPQQQQQHNLEHSKPSVSQQQLLQLVTMGIEATLCQLVVTGVLHADPHPGNLLLTPEGQLAYLDFGLLVTVPADAQLAMMSALLHWALADWRALARDLGDMGLLKDSTDQAQLAADLQQQFSQLYSSSGISRNGGATGASSAVKSVAVSAEVNAAKAVPAPPPAGAPTSSNTTTPQRAVSSSMPAAAEASTAGQRLLSLLLSRAGSISFGDFAGVIAALALKYRFELPPYYTLVIRSLTTLEGFALSVDPSTRYGIAQAAVRVVARQLLEDRRPAAQQLLLQVLQDPQQPGQLNMPLFEELLLLRKQQQQRNSVTAESNLGSQLHSAGTPVAAAAQRSQQSSSTITTAQPRLLSSLAVLLQQLDASQLARQLSGQKAEGVRVALAQHIVSCWLQNLASTQQSQGILPSSVVVCGDKDATSSMHKVLVGGRRADCPRQLQDMYGTLEGRRTNKKKTSMAKMAATWLRRAGWRGVVFAWQLLCAHCLAASQRQKRGPSSWPACVACACRFNIECLLGIPSKQLVDNGASIACLGVTLSVALHKGMPTCLAGSAFLLVYFATGCERMCTSELPMARQPHGTTATTIVFSCVVLQQPPGASGHRKARTFAGAGGSKAVALEGVYQPLDEQQHSSCSC